MILKKIVLNDVIIIMENKRYGCAVVNNNSFKIKETEIKKFSIKYYKEFKKIYLESFSKENRFSIFFLMINLILKRTNLYILTYNNELLAFLYSITYKDIRFILYLAVKEKYRNCKIGSRLLNWYIDKNPNKTIYLNIDEVNDKYEDIITRRKRLSFYLKNNFYLTDYLAGEDESKGNILSTNKFFDIKQYKKMDKKISNWFLCKEDIIKMKQLLYRKANKNDINQIADLVTKLIGTCNLNPKKSIMDNNIDEISKTINDYYVCESGNKIVGACGLSDVMDNDRYGFGFKNSREILYLVVDNDYQKKGIGTTLLKKCCENIDETIIYEAWGDNGEYVNSKYLLEKANFKLYKNLGNDYYKKHNYCALCCNKNKKCDSCLAEIWIKK